jgi:hypothetical protein
MFGRFGKFGDLTPSLTKRLRLTPSPASRETGMWFLGLESLPKACAGEHRTIWPSSEEAISAKGAN